jgi:hypothetical protein
MTDVTGAGFGGNAPASVRYPFGLPPAPGNALEVSRRVQWIRMPLPFSLDHINVWKIADGDGWPLVDMGAHTDTATTARTSLCRG